MNYQVSEPLPSTTMHDAQLLTYYASGWIPGPKETEGSFLARIEAFQLLEQALEEGPLEFLPFSPQELAPSSLQHEAEQQAAAYYGTVLHNVPLFCSAKQMAPWQAAMTWICELQLENKAKNNIQGTVTLIQLHPRFAKESILWGLYHREELLVHELAHAGRAAFHEPKFEEILAYLSAGSPFRRWLGPLFATTTEALIMILLISALLCAESFMLFFGTVFDEKILLSLWMLPILGLMFLLLRLWWRKAQFERAFMHLKRAFAHNEPQARAVLYCLSDKEITRLSQSAYAVLKMAQPKGKECSLHDRLIALLIQRALKSLQQVDDNGVVVAHYQCQA